MPFTTPIVLNAPLIDGDEWLVVEPLHFWSRDKQKHYVAAAGFHTDLASFSLLGDKAAAAAVLHDWLYLHGFKFREIENRQEADEVFLEAMQDTDVNFAVARAMYLAVRWFGASHYQEGHMDEVIRG
jgi:hypothetical protein